MSDLKAKLQKLAEEAKSGVSDLSNPKTEKALAGLDEEKKKDLEQARKLREVYAKKLFWMVCVWLILILAITTFQGFEVLNLSDSVLITLITTTTANVAAYFLVVTKYLFPNK